MEPKDVLIARIYSSAPIHALEQKSKEQYLREREQQSGCPEQSVLCLSLTKMTQWSSYNQSVTSLSECIALTSIYDPLLTVEGMSYESDKMSDSHAKGAFLSLPRLAENMS